MVLIYFSVFLLAAFLCTPSDCLYPNRNDGRGPFGPIRKGPTPVTSMPMKTWKLEFPTPQTADTRTVASSSFDLNSLISKLPKDHLTVVVDAVIKNLNLNAASNEKEIAALTQKLDRLTVIVEGMRNSLSRSNGNFPSTDNNFWTKRRATMH